MIGFFYVLASVIGYVVVSSDEVSLFDMDDDDEPGDPLILTSYLEEGLDENARVAAEVTPFLEHVKSYSGFLTVDSNHNSNMFFWYFPAEEKPREAPVIIWLQGGPGTSSMFGLFLENGPYYLDCGKLKRRQFSWSKYFHMVYVDNPVGTGFSFADDSGICRNQTCIGDNLYSFVTQFFTMFPSLKENDLYLSGQSYGCKYVATLGHLIQINDPNGENIKLKGVTIGNGWCDPENMLDSGTYLYQLGIIDEPTKNKFDNVNMNIVKSIKDSQWEPAFDMIYKLMSTDPSTSSLFQNETGFSTAFNIFTSTLNSSNEDWKKFVKDEVNRRSLHVGNKNLQHYLTVFRALKDDYMRSVAPLISQLANDYKVLIYSGQLDMIVPYVATANFIKQLKWNGSENYKTAKRKIWMDRNGQIAGYIKNSAPTSSCGSLTEVMIRNAGHLVPRDQPEWALQLITGFIRSEYPFISNISSLQLI